MINTIESRLATVGDAVEADELVSSSETCEVHEVHLIVRRVQTAHGMNAESTVCPLSGRGDCAHTEQVVWQL